MCAAAVAAALCGCCSPTVSAVSGASCYQLVRMSDVHPHHRMTAATERRALYHTSDQSAVAAADDDDDEAAHKLDIPWICCGASISTT